MEIGIGVKILFGLWLVGVIGFGIYAIYALYEMVKSLFLSKTHCDSCVFYIPSITGKIGKKSGKDCFYTFLEDKSFIGNGNKKCKEYCINL